MKRVTASAKGHSTKLAVSQVRTGKRIPKTNVPSKKWWTDAIADLPAPTQKLIGICAEATHQDQESFVQDCVRKHLLTVKEHEAAKKLLPVTPAPLNPLADTDCIGIKNTKRIQLVADAFGQTADSITNSCIHAGLKSVVADLNAERAIKPLKAIILINDQSTPTQYRGLGFLDGALVYYDGKAYAPVTLKESVARYISITNWWNMLETQESMSGNHEFDEPTMLRWLGMINKAL